MSTHLTGVSRPGELDAVANAIRLGKLTFQIGGVSQVVVQEQRKGGGSLQVNAPNLFPHRHLTLIFEARRVIALVSDESEREHTAERHTKRIVFDLPEWEPPQGLADEFRRVLTQATQLLPPWRAATHWVLVGPPPAGDLEEGHFEWVSKGKGTRANVDTMMMGVALVRGDVFLRGYAGHRGLVLRRQGRRLVAPWIATACASGSRLQLHHVSGLVDLQTAVLPMMTWLRPMLETIVPETELSSERLKGLFKEMAQALYTSPALYARFLHPRTIASLSLVGRAALTIPRAGTFEMCAEGTAL